MAAGMSGEGPGALDSTVKLDNLVPRIAQYRDEFYQGWIDRIPGELGDRLRADAKRVQGITRHYLPRPPPSLYRYTIIIE